MYNSFKKTAYKSSFPFDSHSISIGSVAGIYTNASPALAFHTSLFTCSTDQKQGIISLMRLSLATNAFIAANEPVYH